MGVAARKMRRSSWSSFIGPACASSRAVSSSSRTLAVVKRAGVGGQVTVRPPYAR